MSVTSIEVKVGKRDYKISGDRVWVLGFGTTGPGQTPHYNWIPVDHGSASHKEAMTAKKEGLRT